MSYIGKQPVVGNFQKCDAISVVNGQAAYTLNVGGAAVTPENANHMLVSLNGVLQAPGDSFTVSGSTLTFASNLATGDVIDFVIILGDVLDLGTPSDNSISTAKLVANSVTAAKFNADVISGQTALAEAPADTDEFLVSDGGVIKRIDYSLIKGGGMFELISTTTVTSGVSSVDFTSLSSDFADFRLSASQVDIANDNEILRIRAFVGGSEHTSSDYQYVRRGFNGAAAETEDQAGGTEWRIGDNIGNAGGESASFEFTIFAVHDTSHSKQYLSQFAGQANDSAPVYQAGGGNLDNTSAITGLKVYQASGNINSGVFSLYGRKR
jgi:hypothetical protein